MIRYVPSSAAEPLSNALWGLARPPELREPQDTQYMFPWVDDQNTPPRRWLMVEDAFSVPVHVDASYEPIRLLLQPWMDSGHLPPDTHETLEDIIDAHRGQNLVVWDAFPQVFKDNSITQQQMEDANWQPVVNVLFAARKR